MVDKDDEGTMPINVRSPEQWKAISAVMDFEGKTVLDAGCGYGDLLLFAKGSGAQVTGVEHNIIIANAARDRGLDVACIDINSFMDKCGHYCTAFCFSVLPYVPVQHTLHQLSQVADVAFIECQLVGDGPGIFEDEDKLREALLQYWPKVTRIGETKVAIRDTIRAIWMCEKGETNE